MPDPLIKHDETMCRGVVGGCACRCRECDQQRAHAREMWLHRPRRRDDDGLQRLGKVLADLDAELTRLQEREADQATVPLHGYRANRAPMDSDKQLCLRCGLPPEDQVHLPADG